MSKFFASTLFAAVSVLSVSAFAQDHRTPTPDLDAPSTLSRAEVRAAAAADLADKQARGYQAETGTYLVQLPVASTLSRADVREQALQASADRVLVVESNS